MFEFDPKRAADIIRREYGHSQNFMTPNLIRYGFITDRIVYEFTKGKGIDGESIYGVTVVQYNPEDDTTERLYNFSGCFSSKGDAERHITRMIKTGCK